MLQNLKVFKIYNNIGWDKYNENNVRFKKINLKILRFSLSATKQMPKIRKFRRKLFNFCVRAKEFNQCK